MLDKEVPHGIAVEITKFDEGRLVKVDADIVCAKNSHKGIVIGKGGKTLKKIGSMAREAHEEL